MSANTTQLLREWGEGKDGSFDRLFPHVYDQLKVVAHHRLLRHRPGDTIETTMLVHEAYVKLVDVDQVIPSDRSHFMAVASRAMRFILVDYARARTAKKRGGGEAVLSLDEVQVSGDGGASAEIITLNAALDKLSEYDERLGRVVEYRFFGGMEYQEIADATGLSVPTVKRDWARARAWLYEFMTEGESGQAAP